MQLQEIKDAVNAGITVYWQNNTYTVFQKNDELYIKAPSTITYLEWIDGETRGYLAKDFYTKETKADVLETYQPERKTFGYHSRTGLPNMYRVTDRNGFDPIGECLTEEKAREYCEKQNNLSGFIYELMEREELSTLEELYDNIADTYGHGYREIARVYFAMLSPEQQTEAAAYLDASYHYEALDNDEQVELQSMISWLKQAGNMRLLTIEELKQIAGIK